MNSWKSKKEFKLYVTDTASELNVSVNSIQVRKMTKKWASCSSARNLTFDEALLGMDKEVGKYVVLHELMHLRIPNHGKLWKSYMSIYMSGHELIERKVNFLSYCKSA